MVALRWISRVLWALFVVWTVILVFWTPTSFLALDLKTRDGVWEVRYGPSANERLQFARQYAGYYVRVEVVPVTYVLGYVLAAAGGLFGAIGRHIERKAWKAWWAQNAPRPAVPAPAEPLSVDASAHAPAG